MPSRINYAGSIIKVEVVELISQSEELMLVMALDDIIERLRVASCSRIRTFGAGMALDDDDTFFPCA